MADEQIADTSTVVADDDKPVTEDDLRDLKYDKDGVETSQKDADEPTKSTEEDETTEETVAEEEGETDSEEESSEEQSTFVKEFPNIKGDTPEEYAKNLEIAYQNSTAEALRLKDATTATADSEDEENPQAPSMTDLYVKQELDNKMKTAWGNILKTYPEATDQTEYNKFTKTVAELNNTILQSEGRLAAPEELYSKSAVILDWEANIPTAEDKLKMAVKDSASSGKTGGATKKVSTSKVTEAMLAANRKMYPGKTDTEIRKELEPYI